jgi:sulfide:quinone oxidoreductase
MLVNDFLGRNGATVEIFAAEPGPMGTAGPEISAAVRSMVEAQGIAYHPNHQIDHVDAAGRHLRFADGTSAPFDVLLYVPPHQSPAVVREARLTGPSGWISVDREKLTTSMPGVYAIGDVTAIPLSSGKMLPKAGVFAHAHAEIVAASIAAEWGYDATPRPFDGKGGCFLETGGGRAGFGNGDFYAEPAPQMRLHKPSRLWHLSKVLFEKRWLHKWF